MINPKFKTLNSKKTQNTRNLKQPKIQNFELKIEVLNIWILGLFRIYCLEFRV